MLFAVSFLLRTCATAAISPISSNYLHEGAREGRSRQETQTSNHRARSSGLTNQNGTELHATNTKATTTRADLWTGLCRRRSDSGSRQQETKHPHSSGKTTSASSTRAPTIWARCAIELRTSIALRTKAPLFADWYGQQSCTAGRAANRPFVPASPRLICPARRKALPWPTQPSRTCSSR